MRLIDADRLFYNLERGVRNTSNQVFREIASTPTIEAEPVRHGHWVRNDNGTYSCSECHSWIPNEQYYYARYCLFCGAKMGGERE